MPTGAATPRVTLAATPATPTTPATKSTLEKGQALRSFLLEQTGLVAAPVVVGEEGQVKELGRQNLQDGFYEALWRLAAAHESSLAVLRSHDPPEVPEAAVPDPVPPAKTQDEDVPPSAPSSSPAVLWVKPSTQDGEDQTEPLTDDMLIPGVITASVSLPPLEHAHSHSSESDDDSKASANVAFRPAPLAPSEVAEMSREVGDRSMFTSSAPSQSMPTPIYKRNRTQSRRFSKDDIRRRASAKGFQLRGAWASPDLFIAQRRVSMNRTKIIVPSYAYDEELHGQCWLHRFVLHPSSHKRFSWDLACMTLLAYDLAVIPFMEAFEPQTSDFLKVMTWFTMFWWTLDMLVSCLTGYHYRKVVVLDPWLTVWHYLKTWFILDISIVTLDWVLAVLGGDAATSHGGSAARLGRSLRTLRFVRTLRLVRLLKLKRIIQEIHDQIDTESLSICFGILKILLTLCVANHLVACGWFAIGSAGPTLSWVHEFGMDDRTTTYQYSTSLHWSLTQFTPASMEIVPVNERERVYTVLVILIAMMMFSSFLSILTALMAELRDISNDAPRQFWLLRRYFNDWAVSREVAARVHTFLEYAYQHQKKRVQEKEVRLLTLLSEPLREELKFETFRLHLGGHPLFLSISDSMRTFAKAMKQVVLARGDVFFTCGETGLDMLILTQGMLEYVLGEDEDDRSSRGNTNPPEDVPEGQWVGEAAMWTPWLHLGDLHALTECQAITVNVVKFEKLAQLNQPVWSMLQRYAKRFVTELNEIDTQDLTDLLHKIIRPDELIENNPCYDNNSTWLRRRTRSFHTLSTLASVRTAWDGLLGRTVRRSSVG